jgi:hypothetical protein
MTLIAGTKLGPYDILSPLGAGGMGEVEPLGRRLSRPAKSRAQRTGDDSRYTTRRL